MTRKIKINGFPCEDLKICLTNAERQNRFETWYISAPTPEAKARRRAVGVAFMLTIPS